MSAKEKARFVDEKQDMLQRWKIQVYGSGVSSKEPDHSQEEWIRHLAYQRHLGSSYSRFSGRMSDCPFSCMKRSKYLQKKLIALNLTLVLFLVSST